MRLGLGGTATARGTNTGWCEVGSGWDSHSQGYKHRGDVRLGLGGAATARGTTTGMV